MVTLVTLVTLFMVTLVTLFTSDYYSITYIVIVPVTGITAI